jgi:hypothetical protein
MHRLLRSAGFAGLFAIATSAAGQSSVRTVVLSGDPVASAAPGLRVDHVDAATINDHGVVAIRGRLAGDGVTALNEQASLHSSAGALKISLRQGDPVAGLPTDHMLFSPGFPRINNLGRVAHSAVLSGPGVTADNNLAVVADLPSGPAVALRLGQPVSMGGIDHTLSYLDFNAPHGDDGTIAMTTILRTPLGAEGAALMVYRPGIGAAPIAFEGDHLAPQQPTLGFTSFQSPMVNARGDVAFWGHSVNFIGGAADVWDGVFRRRNGTNEVVAMRGDPAPGLANGVTFSAIFYRVVGMNDAGQVAFFGDVTGPGVTGTNYRGLFAGEPGALRTIVRTGDRAPGTPTGVTYRNFYEPVINAHGHAAFDAFLTGPGVTATSEHALFVETATGIRQLARVGGRAPGTPTGVQYDFVSTTPALNAQGLVAFTATLRGTGVNQDNNLGLFATDSSGVVQLIARKGSLFDVDGDPLVSDLRTIQQMAGIGPSGGQDGHGQTLSDTGELVFALQFTDGTSGVFATRLAPIPEPTTAALLLLALAAPGARGQKLRVDFRCPIVVYI